MKRKTAIATLSVQKRLFTVLLFSTIALIVLYGFFVSKSIVNVLIRGEVLNAMATIHSTTGDLESQYIVLKNAIDVEFAYTLGFTDIDEKIFVARKSPLGKSLSVNDEI